MNTKSLSWLWLLIGIILLFGVLFLRGAEDTIASDDGNMTLRVKTNALPDGTEPEDMRITKADEPIVAVGDRQTVAEYILEPNGLLSSQPMEFELRVSMPDGTLPAVYHLSSGTIERMGNIEINMDETNTAIIHGTIDHFSRIILTVDTFTVSVTHPKEAFVGQTVPVRATTTKNPQSQTQTIELVGGPGVTFGSGLQGTFRGNIKYSDPWQLTGMLTANPENIVTPSVARDLPKKQDVSPPAPAPDEIFLTPPSSSFTATGNFTCTRPGKVRFTYEAHITARETVEWITNEPNITFIPASGPIQIRQQGLHIEMKPDGDIDIFRELECKNAPSTGGDGDGDGDSDGNGNGDGDGDDGGLVPPEDPDTEPIGNDECPDCFGLEQKLTELQEQERTTDQQITQAGQDLENAEDTQDQLDADLDALIAEAGCSPEQNTGGNIQSGQSTGKVSSRNREFFCPDEAAAERMTQALERFWQTHESPSSLREKIRNLTEDLKEIQEEIQKVEKELEKCPCDAAGGGMMVQIGPPYLIICPKGGSISGTQKIDANGNPMYDAAGNIIDADIGQSVSC